MRLSVVGASGTFPTQTKPASGYVVEHEGTRIWCDTGPGTFTSLPCDPGLIDAVFISHRHPDHCTDLFTAYHAWTYVPDPRSAVPLYASRDVLEHLAGFIDQSSPANFGKTFDLLEIGDGDSAAVGSIQADFLDVSHSVPTLGSRWSAGGRSLFYTGDTGPGPWSGAVEDADVFLCEAALQGERVDSDFIHHLNAFEAGEIARSADVGRLVLTHIPPYMDPSISIDQAESTFEKAVTLASPGAQIEV